MEIIKLKNSVFVCDEIHYEVKDNVLAYVDFFLHNKPVMTEFKNSLTGCTVEEVKKKVPTATINPTMLLILKEFAKHLETTSKNLDIKNKIHSLKTDLKK